MREARAELRPVTEREYVRAVDAWLDGGPWQGSSWIFGPRSGAPVRLVETGDELAQDGVVIVSRNPIRLHEPAPDKRTAKTLEAHALAAVAVRGDAGWYVGEPRKHRPGVELTWTGLRYVQVPHQRATP